MKKQLSFILAFIISVCINSSALAATSYGLWAEQSIITAISSDVLDYSADRNYYFPITRIELADLLSKTLKSINTEFKENISDSFSDTDEQSATDVASLGIMNGYGDGTFLPQNITSRQEMAKIILMFKSVVDDIPLTLPIDLSSDFKDFSQLSEWAKPYVVKATSDGLLSGYTDGSFGGLNPVSWQEAIVLLHRVVDFNSIDNKITYISEEFNLKTEVTENTLNITWDKIDDTKVHTLTITEQRISRYENDIPPNTPQTLYFTDVSNYSLDINPNKKYTISISCGDAVFSTNIFTEKLISADMTTISENYPTTKEDAENIVTEVTVPIWKLVNNVKMPSEATFKVHNSIAEKVVKIFEEIFSGPEQFPIKDVNSYAWRGGTTEHNGGTAIDINSNENYCIYNDGTTIGSHWKPYEDPYSITPYGDVVRAFEKYGFTWGGDSWSNPKDYMHFSYLGT